MNYIILLKRKKKFQYIFGSYIVIYFVIDTYVCWFENHIENI